MERKDVIRIQGLSLSYGSRVLCPDVAFTLAPGECLLLAGANGSGKSTLLRTLARTKGWTFIPAGIPKVKGFTVEEFVRTGCYRESNWAGKLRPAAEKRMQRALTLLGLQALRKQDIASLSDGEFQKACIAVGLTLPSEVLLLDEPTAYLDVENRIMVLSCLRNAARESGTAVIFSSHELHEALQSADRVLAFAGGRLLVSDTENRTDILRTAFPACL